ncbi:NAD(P)/FAD-dependent oxidoreductase [soil metagenome]
MALKQITVAGGGLAGLALGVALRQREIPVQILEAAAYPRHRVCGEFISGIQEDELKALGITDLFTSAARHRETAWFDGSRILFRATLPEAAYGLSRHHLDAALAERFVSSGGELQTSTRFTGDAEVEGTVLASGRPQRASEWLGMKAHFEDLALTADLEIHLGNHAYVGLTRVEHDRVNVSGLFRRTSAVSGGQQALATAVQEAGLPELADRLRAARIDSSSLKGVNRFHLGWQAHRDAAVRIGDAAAMIPPFTGNGMTMALQSALAAVEPLARWSQGEGSWHDAHMAIQQEQSRLFSTRLRWARVLQEVLLQPLGRRLCAYAVNHQWVSFETLYRKVR